MRFFLAFLVPVLVGLPTTVAVADSSEKPIMNASSVTRGDVIGLFNNTTDSRRRLAYLVIDDRGRALIYPSPITNPRTCKNNDLWTMSLTDIQQLWGQGLQLGDIYEFEFVGYQSGVWGHFKVALKTKNGTCLCFRVLGPGLTNEDWLLAMSIPSVSAVESAKDASGKLRLPPWIGCLEAPYDASRCGYDPP